MKFKQMIVAVPDEGDELHTEPAELVMDALGATALFLREEYKKIFDGVDDMYRAINAYNEREKAKEENEKKNQ